MTALRYGLIYGAVTTGYLFSIMITMSPRVWGYADYPPTVKAKVPPQTHREKALAAVIGVPWFLFVIGFPIYSTFTLKSGSGGDISFATAFFNVAVQFGAATFGDLVILDWLIISKITPKFAIIPGSSKDDYKDFSHHYRGHAKAAGPMIIFALILAALASAI